MQRRVARRLPRGDHRVRVVPAGDRRAPGGSGRADQRRSRSAPTPSVFAPDPARPEGAGPDRDDGQRRRAAQGPASAGRGGGEAAHRAARRAGGHRLGRAGRPGRRGDRAVSAWRGAVRFVSGISDVDLVAELRSAEVAVVPSLFEGFSLPAVEAMACGDPAGGHHGRRAARGGRHRRRDGAAGAAGRRGARWPRRSAGCSTTTALRARLGAAGRERVLASYTWRAAAAAHRRAATATGVPRRAVKGAG